MILDIDVVGSKMELATFLLRQMFSMIYWIEFIYNENITDSNNVKTFSFLLAKKLEKMLGVIFGIDKVDDESILHSYDLEDSTHKITLDIDYKFYFAVDIIDDFIYLILSAIINEDADCLKHILDKNYDPSDLFNGLENAKCVKTRFKFKKHSLRKSADIAEIITLGKY